MTLRSDRNSGVVTVLSSCVLVFNQSIPIPNNEILVRCYVYGLTLLADRGSGQPMPRDLHGVTIPPLTVLGIAAPTPVTRSAEQIERGQERCGAKVLASKPRFHEGEETAS